MKQDKPKSKQASELRKKAEDKLRAKMLTPEKITDADIRELIHELQVYQIELEMQNDELLKAQVQIEESLQKYYDLYDFAPVGYFTFDEKGIIREANLTAADQLGIPRDFLIKRQFYHYINQQDQDIFYLHLKKLSESKMRQSCEIRLKGKTGKEFYAQLTSVMVWDSSCYSYRTSIIDITERKRMEEEIKNIAKFPMENPYPVLRIAHDGTLLYANSSSTFLLHFWNREVGQIVPDSLYQLVADVFRTRSIKRDVEIKHRDQTYSFTIVPVKDTDYVNLYGKDITERKQIEEKIKHMAFHDALTFLPNRILFHDRLTLVLAHAHRNKEMFAVLFLDLDRFKDINDTLGHTMGDQLLRDVANRLKGCIREEDTIARFAGDEFTLLLLGITEAEHVRNIAQKILDAVKQPLMLGGHELSITTSIGIAIYPGNGEDVETLLKNADTAMYHAKEQGRNNYQFYTETMHDKSFEKMMLESSIRRALDREEFVVYYQPLVNISTGKIASMEALVRWLHPELGLILPEEFLALSENTRLIVFIDELVLYTVCVQSRVWQDAGFQPMCVAVNLSAHTFQQPNLVETITSVLQKTDLDPHFLCLEITESIAMQDIETTIQKLNKLSDLGIQIAIDDFGTGFSSLYYLKKFPVNKLKISQHFVSGIVADQNDKVIVESVIALARTLKFKVVAEGVETEEQLIFLKQQQCDEMQGYLFCKPLPAESFGKMLVQGKHL